jgi:hypothetical protein
VLRAKGEEDGVEVQGQGSLFSFHNLELVVIFGITVYRHSLRRGIDELHTFISSSRMKSMRVA